MAALVAGSRTAAVQATSACDRLMVRGRHRSAAPCWKPARLGLGSSPAWWHTSVFAAIDSRESPGYTASGGLYRITLHDYADPGGLFSFDRTEIDLRQFIPILHNNWIITMQARADMTDAAQDQVIPYFMLPSIGGRDTIPGFEDYRFTDKDSLLLRAELRWTPSSVLSWRSSWMKARWLRARRR